MEAGDADDHAADQFAENRRLAETLRERAEEFCSDEDGDESEEKLSDRQVSVLS
jgi:hypothetical protein